MTYEQALSFVERIKDIAIGAPLDGRVIQSLAIGPTDWEQMSDFLNLRIQREKKPLSLNSPILVRAFQFMAYLLLMWKVVFRTGK